MFRANGYPGSFIDKIFKKFMTTNKNESDSDTEEKPKYYISLPYFEYESQHFLKSLNKIIARKINITITPLYKSFKIGRYFPLKSRTPLPLCSNVVYKFTSSCDMNMTYYGKSSRHLSTRVNEHLDFKGMGKSAIKDHILSCTICCDVRHGLNSFSVIRKCKSDFHAKIHEALLIKKHAPRLNRHLFGSGASFLLQVF